MAGMTGLTVQSLLKMKRFGDYRQGTRPLQYRRADWIQMARGKERALRLLVKSTLGVPSAHHSDQDYPMWCFQFPDGGELVVLIARGGGQVQLVARNEEESRDLKQAVDFLLEELGSKLRQL
ncbi:MAG: hypothetical protein DIU70_007430 [Bacillota bacterium]|nr:MAG: hypothetical protein DIU70_12980 [Bacillota bacterium]